jgi:hypothetical protein
VEFDDAGIVKRVETFDDSKALQRLAPVAADTPVPLATPLELPVKFWKAGNSGLIAAKIVLSADTFAFEELGDQKKRQKFSLPAQDVLRVETPMTVFVPDPIYTGQRLHFARNLKNVGGPAGKDLNLEVTLPQLVMLMSYASQAAKSPQEVPDGKKAH